MPTREERERIEREYGDLYQAVCEVLYEEDPIGIGFGDNADEYDPEAFTILPRLADCRSAEELRTVIHEEFVRWFETLIGPDPQAPVAMPCVSTAYAQSAGDRYVRCDSWAAHSVAPSMD